MPINLGNTLISAFRLGSSQVSKIYLGNSVVFSVGVPAVISVDYDATDGTMILTTDKPAQGTIEWARVADGAAAPTYNGVTWSSAIEEDGFATPASGEVLTIQETGTTGTAYDLYIVQVTPEGQSNIVKVDYIAENTAPVISDVDVVGDDATLFGRIITDSSGIIWAVWTDSATTPSADQIKSGLDHTGAEAIQAEQFTAISGYNATSALSGQTNDVTRHLHVVAEDSFANQSLVASGSGSATATPVSITLGTPTEVLTDNANSTSHTSAAYDATGSSVVLALAGFNGQTAAPSVTYGGVTMDLLQGDFVTGLSGGGVTGIYYLDSASVPSGSQTFVITADTSISNVSAWVVPISDEYEAAPAGPSDAQAGEFGDVDATLTPNEPGMSVVAVAALQDASLSGALVPTSEVDGTIVDYAGSTRFYSALLTDEDVPQSLRTYDVEVSGIQSRRGMTAVAFRRASGAVSGGGPWTPADTTTEMWLDFNDASTITLSGSAVTQVDDKSGNARHATQSDPTRYPVYSATGWDGVMPAITMNGNEAHLDLGLIPADVDVLTVFKAGTLDDSLAALWGGDTGGNRWIMPVGADGNSATTVLIIDDTTNPSGTTMLFDGETSQSVTTRNQAYDALQTKSLFTVANVQSTSSAQRLGAAEDPATFGFEGEIAEFVVIPTNTTERQKVEGYLAHKWGFEASLPSGHPYKSAPPTT